VAPFFLTRCGQLPEPVGPDATWPLARNFEKMGVVFMRSDWTEEAACAALVAGGEINSHRHYDQGHFIIYRKGHLAIDSGDYGPREANEHLKEYAYRTVAHNSILIHAPPAADERPKVWGETPDTFDGGQMAHAGRQIAFETHDAYSYAATDMAPSYSPKKCRHAVRQFVFVRPDVFVIFDRVGKVKPEYASAWLLHSVDAPETGDDGRTFRIVEGDGALAGVTLLPQAARVELVGGPGKEFFSAGKNRPQQGAHKRLAGAWRVEVSPSKASSEDIFLHVLRVGDKSLRDAGDVQLVPQGDFVGAAFQTGDGRDATVTFRLRGPVGGRIVIGAEDDGSGGINAPLATTVQPQAGLGIVLPEP
jgi:heparin/heparan-sulfate lyase